MFDRAIQGCAAAILAGCLLLPEPGAAQQQPRRSLIEQKLAFAGRVLDDSAALERIAASADPRARELLAQGAAEFARAQAALGAGDLSAAEASANSALAALGKARRIAPGGEQIRARERMRFAQLLVSTESLLASYRRRAASPDAAHGDGSDALAQQTARQIDTARELARGDAQLTAALRALEQAEARLLEAIVRQLGATTLVYTPRFDSPREELEFELSRLRGLHELVPLAIRELRPSAQARERMARHIDRAESIRRAALMQAELGNHEAALAAMREAVAGMQQALANGGVVTPRH